MKKILFVSALFPVLLWNCQTDKMMTEKKQYLRWVGDIESNKKMDKPDFKICNGDENVYQYFNVGQGPVYVGEKVRILDTFKEKYKPVSKKDQNGLIRIRFVVNCDGKAGRFRVIQSDYNYQKKEFDKSIVSQLLEITKGIEDWVVLEEKDTPVDYYMYLIFKITDGKIIEILP